MANHKKSPLGVPLEPPDHAIGRSRGGLSTKVHQLCDGKGRPLVCLLGPGNGGDSPMLALMLEHLRVARRGPGRPRTRPQRLIADSAYSSRANRQMMSARHIKVVIPERANHAANRKRKGSLGGRPPGFDAQAYRGRNVVERWFNQAKQWRGIATRYDKLALTYRGAVVLAAIITWAKVLRDTP